MNNRLLKPQLTQQNADGDTYEQWRGTVSDIKRDWEELSGKPTPKDAPVWTIFFTGFFLGLAFGGVAVMAYFEWRM